MQQLMSRESENARGMCRGSFFLMGRDQKCCYGLVVERGLGLPV